MSRSLSRVQALLLGSVVLAALLLTAAALSLIGERSGWGGAAFRVHVGFPDINGVEVGSRVRIQGIDAGEVEAIVAPERPGERVQLRLRIAAKYQPLVRSDARAEIISENLLAGKLVRILPGAVDAPPVADGAELTAEVRPDLLEGIAQAAARLNRLLTEVDGAMAAFRQREGTAGSVSDELLQATGKLNRVLTKADIALGRIEKGEGTLGKLIQDETLYRDLTGTLSQVKAALSDVEKGNGTLGKLVKSNEVYAETVTSLQEMRRMVASVKQNSDAIKSLPVVRSYVIDPEKELVRPDCERLRRWLPANDVFEPGKAVLTSSGRKLLDEAAGWLNEHKETGSEVVVASFTDQGAGTEFANTLTQKQSEVAADYLRGQHRIHRLGWWSSRTVRAVGCGDRPSPTPETEKLPAGRLELIVFVPQG